MDRIKALTVFIRVVETGSFSKCASELGLGQPSVSKTIDALESELGVKLLRRSTRSLALTEEGKKLLDEARKVVEAYAELLATAQLKAVPQGIVRVTCPTALGSLYLIPRLPAFSKKHPDIKVHLKLSDTFLDLVEGDIDVAFRVGEIAAGNFVAKKVGRLQRIAVAGEPYLAAHPAPKTLPDLRKHSCIVVTKNGTSAIWSTGQPDGASQAIEVQGRYVVDSHLAVRAAVEAGLGIGLAAQFIFEERGRLAKGLVRVLRKVPFQSYPVHILFQQAKNLPARTRLFVDFFYEDLRKQAWMT
ncbi:MAG: LysR family transcriptional regulator [Betaproteobacteria bacterium]|nr:LysR family transcriptional regulator [Betaproteobacteria bacterium]